MPTRVTRGLRAAALLVLFAALALARVQLPGYVAADELDASWAQAYGHFWRHARRAGVDYVFNFGPLGYLYGYAYDAALFEVRVVWGVIYAGLASGVLVDAVRRLPLGPALLLAVVLLTMPLAGDALPALALLAATLALLRAARPSRTGAVVLVAVAGVLGLVKFTYLMAGGLCAAALALHLWRTRGAATAAVCLLAGAVVHAGVWLAWGQALADWPRWFLRSVEMARSYSAGMVLEGDPAPVRLALVSVGCFAAGAILLVVRPGGLARDGLAVGLTSVLLFLGWKHGFVRQDLHVLAFFHFASAAPLLLWPRTATPSARDRWSRRVAAGLLVATVVVALAGEHRALAGASPPRPLWTWPGTAVREARVTFHRLADLPGTRARLERLRAERTETFALPRVRAAVGDDTVDLVSVKQGLVFLNELTWRNRPVFQGYQANSPSLAALNAAFFASPDAPDWVLLDGAAIDGHLPTLDDGAALLEILQRYRPVLVEGGLVLLRREPAAARPAPPPVLLRTTVALGTWVDLGGLGAGPKRLRLTVQPSRLGRLRELLFRAPIVRLQLDLGSHRETYRLVPGMIEPGVLLDPLPFDQYEMALVAIGEVEALASPRALRVRVRPDERRWLAPVVDVEVDALPPLPWAAVAPDAPVRRELWARWVPSLGVPAVRVAGVANPIDVPTLGPALLLHAPGALRLAVPDEATSLAGHLGLAAGVDGSGRGDGVTFTVTDETAGAARVLFTRRLEPRAEPGDRGPQPFRVPLPAGTGRILTLRTEPGPSTAWDWSYWGQLRFLDAAGTAVDP